MRTLKLLMAVAMTALLLSPVVALAKPGDTRRVPRIVVYPKPPAKVKTGRYGFLPGYHQPLPISEWRDRSPQYGGGDFSRNRRYISGWEWRYGWGHPGYYRGRWNGGTFGPCWTNTPIGQVWNCGM